MEAGRKKLKIFELMNESLFLFFHSLEKRLELIYTPSTL
jgi:hypothetical protein